MIRWRQEIRKVHQRLSEPVMEIDELNDGDIESGPL